MRCFVTTNRRAVYNTERLKSNINKTLIYNSRHRAQELLGRFQKVRDVVAYTTRKADWRKRASSLKTQGLLLSASLFFTDSRFPGPSFAAGGRADCFRRYCVAASRAGTPRAGCAPPSEGFSPRVRSAGRGPLLCEAVPGTRRGSPAASSNRSRQTERRRPEWPDPRPCSRFRRRGAPSRCCRRVPRQTPAGRSSRVAPAFAEPLATPGRVRRLAPDKHAARRSGPS